MPNPRTPEQRRAYRARCIAQGRCANCAALRAPDDTQTLCCTRCRARKNRGSNRSYAQARAQNPPPFARKPDTPFRYGKTRLDRPRRITVVLDVETYEAIQACRRNYFRSPAYEPYQVSEVVRRLLRTLPGPSVDGRTGEFIPTTGLRRMHRGASKGISLCFLCDAPAYARIVQHHETFPRRTFAAAVRDCLCYAAQRIQDRLPDRTIKRLLWPGHANTR